MAWLPHEVVTAPAGEPVTLLEVKAQANLDAFDGDFDVEAEIYRKAARQHVERRTGRKIVTQTVLLRGSSFCDAEKFLPVLPVASVTSLKYLDSDGVEQTVEDTVFELVATPKKAFLRLKPGQSWPTTYCARDAVRLTLAVGYGDAGSADIPADLKLACMLLAADWLANREDTTEGQLAPMPNGVRALLSDYRDSL